LSFGHINSGYCSIKTTVGLGTHLSMNLSLVTKSIEFNEPALLVVVIYSASQWWIGVYDRESMGGGGVKGRGVVKDHCVPVRLGY
jgi:hypothetical protein